MKEKEKLFEAAFPYGDDILALPVEDLNQAAAWYSESFGFLEVERRDTPHPTIIMEREGVQIGFAINGLDPENEGAAILVTDIHQVKQEMESRGVSIANWRIDEREGRKFQVFFVAAPDGLCFYFHQPIE